MRKFYVLIFFILVSGINVLFAAAPTITSFAPSTGAVGSSVVITGTNFSTTPANNTVLFGSTAATVTATSQTYSLLITRLNIPQTITFNTLGASVYGDADFAAGATSTNNSIPITYTSSNAAVATITAGGLIHIVGVGNANITASQSGDATYAAATPVIQSLTVNKAALTITAVNASKTYGAANPTLGITYSGFVNGDTNTSLSTQPTITTTASTGSPVGNYPITASGAVAANYNISYTAGTLTVTPATLTIAVNNATKVYGSANPTLSVTYTGFVSTDNAASLTTQPIITTTAVSTSPVGTYPITVSGAGATNYNISYTGGALTVTQATLTIAANNATKVYGSANPTLGVTYTGFVGTDNAASLTTQPGITTTAVTGSPAGAYPITVSGAVSANYSISYIAGTLTVNKATLTITANNATKVYATANPALSVTYAGFVNGDTNTSLTTQPTITTTAVTGSAVGAYPVTESGAVSANYTISYVAGTLTVTPATLTITAGNATKVYGAINPAFSVSYTGFVNGDTNTSLTAQPTISTTAVTGSPVGTYPIAASNAVSANYIISYVTGTLTVNKAALNIAANNVSKTYGAVNPVLTTTYTGFVNGDNQASLTVQPTLTTTALTSSNVGTYPITASGAVSANYTISYTAGTLTVTPAPLVITANNQTKVVNTANPALTISYSGFVNGDTNASLTTQPTISTTAALSSALGTYPITVSGAVSSKYSITYVQGTMTITSSTNANLANLGISAGILSPVFAQATTSYTASVANSVNSLSVIPTTADPGATVTVNGILVSSGAASGNIPLTVGANTINTVVTAQDGVTTNTYTVIITRAPSSNASLSNLTVSNGVLTPSFGTAAYRYFTVVDNTVNQISVTPTLADATASIMINGQPAVNASQSGLVSLLVGDNIITILITAQDGITQLTYTLTVHRATAPDAIKPNNILSPNGDGKNDAWIVKDIQSYPNNKVTIYDRAGRVIYTKNTYTNDWTGTFQGSPLAEGTYYYVIDLGTGDAPLKGFVTIVRQR
jgi:gliding motility-associated-like protein